MLEILYHLHPASNFYGLFPFFDPAAKGRVVPVRPRDVLAHCLLRDENGDFAALYTSLRRAREGLDRFRAAKKYAPFEVPTRGMTEILAQQNVRTVINFGCLTGTHTLSCDDLCFLTSPSAARIFGPRQKHAKARHGKITASPPNSGP